MKRKSANTSKFRIFFRGKLTPECGIGHILDAAELLKDDATISFTVIGRGYLLPFTRKTIQEKGLHNVELISEYISDADLREKIITASLYLGQFENNDRLNRTIPHKAFEALALGVAYLSDQAPAIQEVIIDNEIGFLVPIDDPAKTAEHIANQIRTLLKTPELLDRVAQNGRKLYEEKFTSKNLAEQIIGLIKPAILTK